MYNIEQIYKIIDATPAEMKGKNINEYAARALSVGRKLDHYTRHWWIVYLTWIDNKETYFVAKQGIIQQGLTRAKKYSIFYTNKQKRSFDMKEYTKNLTIKDIERNTKNVLYYLEQATKNNVF